MKQKGKKEGNPRRKIIFHPQTSALLVIDMQQYFCDPSSHAYFKDSAKIVPHIQQLISAYRQRGLPVVFTRYALLRTEDPGSMGRWWNDVLYDDNEMASLVESLRPLPNEPIIRKTQYSAFYETSLETILQKHRVSAVVITGVLTHLCCETTARDAFMRNYDVFFVTDATASDSKRFHTASLTTLSDGFATLITTQEVCGWVKKATSR
jgi:nicotinamidase-related amidase